MKRFQLSVQYLNNSHQEADGGGEPRVGLHHLRRLLLDDERSEKIIKMGPTFVKYI